MVRYTDAIAGAIGEELDVHELDARIAANVLVSVNWQLFRNARKQALAGRHGPGAVRRLRADLKRAYAVLSSRIAAAKLAVECRRLIARRFGLDIAVGVRTRDQLAAIVERNPLAKVAKDPRRYQVSFLDGRLRADVVRKLEEAAAPSERVVVSGLEVYAWHPEGVARSKLWAALAGKGLGVTATARNWTTVTKLLELADD